jgi:hypothetical protein
VEQPKDKGLPKSFLWSFWCRLCFGQTGHAALSYDSEKAVLLACRLDSNFKGGLRTLLQPVIDNVFACQICTRACSVREKGATEASVWFDDLVAQNRFVDRHCEHGLESGTERLSEISLDVGVLRKAADVVNSRASGQSGATEEVSFKIGHYEYPFHGNPRELQINTMHAALSGNDTVRKNLGITVEEASEVLWDQLLEWQSVYFGRHASQKITALVDAAQDKLARQVIAAGPTAEVDLELYTLLEALKHPGDNVSFRVALPNLKLLKDDGSPENEYDVISVVLKKEKHVEVWVWGVTTDQNLNAKRASDMAKIQKLKDLLGGRWEANVRVVTCYVHKEGTDICCEIDGRQERRAYPL